MDNMTLLPDRFPPDLTDDSRRIPYTKFRMLKYRERIFVRENKKFKDISPHERTIGNIILPLPEKVTNSNSPHWEMANLQGVKLLESALSSSTGIVSGVKDGSVIGDLQALFAPQISKIAQQKTPNPKKQALFNGIDPRSFTFNYTFAPQSLHEAERLELLIEKITVNILPAMDTHEISGPFAAEDDRFIENAFFKFPVEFDISFHNVAGFPKLRPCVCTNIFTDYTPTTLQLLESGHAVQVTLSLSFLETELLRSSSPGV